MIPISKPLIGQEEIDAVVGVLKSGMIAQGPKVKEFEEKIAQFCNAKHAVATSSGTSALHAALYAAGVRSGDEVITTPFTFAASANCIMMQGATPVFADIEPDTFNIDPKEIESRITPKTKAILPIDLYGQACDYDVIRDIARKHSLLVIEDACQAIGAQYQERKCGTLGDAGTFSFYATKNLITAEGGMIITDNADYAELARRFRHHGQSEQTRYQYLDLGFNYRMTDIQAAIGIEQLKKLDAWTKKRVSNAEFLSRHLSQISWITVPKISKGNKHVFHQYTIKVKHEKLSRDEIVMRLKDKGIGCGIYYPRPLHMHPHFARLGYKEGMLPVSEAMSKEVISLPVHPSLSDEDLRSIVSAFEEMG